MILFMPSQAPGPLSLIGTNFNQVGIVVEDIERAIAGHQGHGPWSVSTIDRTIVPNLTVGGDPADFAIRVASNTDVPQLELIEPLDNRSPYADWLSAHGAGIHHLGFHVESVPDVTAAMTSAGFEVVLAGSGHGLEGDGAFAYYDTVAALGYLTEARERVRRRRSPDKIVP
jgi:Glyoxalase/Bleomycin resistance protein/Dioxygenase superfamily